MSKFNQLCKAYATARKSFFDYRDECFEFTSWLLEGLVSYLDCPVEQIGYFPLKGDFQPGHTYTLMGAMDLEDDTYWHFGMGITLYEQKKKFPHETVLFEFMIKKADGKFTVKMDAEGTEFHIAKDDPASAHKLYEKIYEEIRESYSSGLQHFLEEDETARKIGFCRDDEAKPKE
ncbi:MAG: hypothetical protein WCS77_04960 [Elusimicrobiaceae bacterium]|jgi:hypothetical protein